MRAVVQRVLNAGVTVDGECVGRIGRGYLVLLGVGHGDTRAEADKLWGKLRGLRINEDENGKTNLALADVDGEVLVVSQFTLFADCRHGRRPSFTDAGAPDVANELYEYFLTLVAQDVEHVAHGIFGADMKVDLVNDGRSPSSSTPITFRLRGFTKPRNYSTLHGHHSTNLSLKPSLAYQSTRRSSFATPWLEWWSFADVNWSCEVVVWYVFGAGLF